MIEQKKDKLKSEEEERARQVLPPFNTRAVSWSIQ